MLLAHFPTSWRQFSGLPLITRDLGDMLLTSSALGLSPGSAALPPTAVAASSSTSAQFASRAARATMSSLAGDGRADGDIPARWLAVPEHERPARWRRVDNAAVALEGVRDPDGDAYGAARRTPQRRSRAAARRRRDTDEFADESFLPVVEPTEVAHGATHQAALDELEASIKSSVVEAHERRQKQKRADAETKRGARG